MRLRPYLVLTILWGLYFLPLVLHPSGTLYAPYSDFLAEHLPAKLFLAREWHATGELPLWNPYHFCGTPFVHDIQVGAYYPPYAVMYVLPESTLGAVLSWVIACHILAAGIFAYIYARFHHLNECGATVAATGFMLSSKWMTHLLLAGHTITIGLAWLPLVLLSMERAIANRSAVAVLGASVALAMVVLGTHPQWAFYGGGFALIWTLPQDRARWVRWAVCWAGAAGVAVLLTAVQLLPTWEASQWSARTRGVEAAGTLTVGVQTFFALVGPSRDYSTPHSWEMQGVFGLYWLTAAAAAPVLTSGRVRLYFGITCAMFLFSVGGAVLVQWLPGFNLFRVPTRMLLVAAFPVAFLAGVATDAVTRAGWSHEACLALARGFRRAVMFAGAPTILGIAFSGGNIWPPFALYWLVLIGSLPLFARILRRGVRSARLRTAFWLALLLMELVAPTATFPETRPQEELYPASPLINPLAGQPERVRVLDYDVGRDERDRASVLGIGAPQSLVRGVPSPRGYNPLDVGHYREFLAFVAGETEPVRGNTPYTQQVLPNFEVSNPRLFRLLCVTHRIAPEEAPVLSGVWRPIRTDEAPAASPPLSPRTPPTLVPHTLSEAADPQPRAWVVPYAERWSSSDLDSLKSCDFSHTVLIHSESPLSHPNGTRPGTGRIVEYRPNRIVVELENHTGGWLVLSEVWYPGWTCRVDGSEVPVSRANHAFRAVPITPGANRVEFTFAPRSYRVGWWISACSVVLVVAVGGLGLLRVIWRNREPDR